MTPETLAKEKKKPYAVRWKPSVVNALVKEYGSLTVAINVLIALPIEQELRDRMRDPNQVEMFDE